MSRSRYICGCCGAEIDVKKTRRAEFTGKWMECLPPAGREWKVPAGKKELVDGSIMYIDTNSNLHKREEFIELFAIDPERAMNYMRSHIQKKTKKQTATSAGVGLVPL